MDAGSWLGTMESVVLRPIGADDDPMVLEVFADTRANELALLPPDMAVGFIAQQWDARVRSYRAAYPGARESAIVVDGTAVGYVVWSCPADLPAGATSSDPIDGPACLVDIAVRAAWRGRGVGTEVIGRLLAEADALGVGVVLHVDVGNPALALYCRVGFVESGRDAVRVAMARRSRGTANRPGGHRQLNTAS
jgi:GNAT superfamily N-acetyltransferase